MMDLSDPSRLQAWRSRSERPWDATSRVGLTVLCAALYLVMSLPIAALARRLEYRWRVSSA